MENPPLSAKILTQALRTQHLGRRVEVLHEVVSTQREFAARGWLSEPEGRVVLAESQTGGCGRMGRRFYAPAGNGIYMSILLKPRLPPEHMVFTTVCAAVAVCRALRENTGLETGVKWVNDIWHNEKKLCGILAEAAITKDRVEHVILGIGVNTGNVPPEVANLATSVSAETGRPVDRNKLAATILNAFEPLYTRLDDPAARRSILADYASRQILLNRRVYVDTFHSRYEALVLGVEDNGGLKIRKDDGTHATLTAGEVTLKPVC